MFSSTRNQIVLVLAVLAVVAALAGAAYVYSKNRTTPIVAILPTPSATLPAPTPTGFGDATATPVATPVPPPPPADVIAVNGWVQVQAGGSLTVRDAPAKAGKRLASMADGTTAHVVDGPKDADGFTWWKVDHYDPKNLPPQDRARANTSSLFPLQRNNSDAKQEETACMRASGFFLSGS